MNRQVRYAGKRANRAIGPRVLCEAEYGDLKRDDTYLDEV
jgi:hypothetical protein